MRLISNLFLSLCALGLVACNRLQPVVVPQFELPISNTSKVQEAIRTGLTNRGWAINETRPGRFEATYRRAGGATARIAVLYSGPQVTIQHLDSSGLEYSEGGMAIHKTYNNWMANLEQEIRVAAGAMVR